MVEISTYVLELSPGIIGAELVMYIRYRLIMICIPINGPSLVYGYNISVLTMCYIPYIFLNNKLNYISYHKVMEAVAAGFLWLYHVSSKIDIIYLLTNPHGPINNYP